MVVSLGRLRILGERKRTTGVPVHPSYGNGYVADVLVGANHVYVLHSSMGYVSQYNKNSDGTIGTRVRTNSWHDYDSNLSFICENNSSVPYGYAMYVEDGKDYLVGWSKGHNALFRWEITPSNNRPTGRTQYNVCNQTMSAYSRGGWDGGRYVYFYNLNDRGIYRWDLQNKGSAQVKVTTLSGVAMSSSFTGSGMLVDASAGEIYMGSGNNTSQGFLGVWSLSTGQQLPATPRNPLRSADLTSIGVSLISGENGNISLTAMHRNIAYYIFTYTGTISELNLDYLSVYPKDIVASTHNVSFVTGEACTVSWDPAKYGDDLALLGTPIYYRVEVNYKGTWDVLVADIEETEYTYIVPSDLAHSPATKYRVLATTFISSGHTYSSHYSPEESPPIAVYRNLFFIVANDILYTFIDGEWVELVGATVDTVTKELYLTYGMVDLAHIPASKWDELGDYVSVVGFTNSSATPVFDLTTQSEYKPIHLFNEELGIHKESAVTWSSGKSGATLVKKAVPHRQLVFPTSDIKLWSPTMPDAVTRIDLQSSQTDGTILKLMFSIDGGENYRSWNGTEWLSFNGLIDSEETKEIINTNGMTVTVLNALTEDQLGLLYGYDTEHRTIRFIYLYESTNWADVNQSAELQIYMDMHGEWQQAKEADYTYGYPTNSELHVQLFTSGSYKVNGFLYGDELAIEQEV